MIPSYTYTPSTDYIHSLSFDYIETYSFQRGPEYEAELKIIRPEYERLKVRKEKRDNLLESEETRLEALSGLLGFTQYLINIKGQFHPSARKTNAFQRNTPEVTRLLSILNTEVRDIPMFMCAPMYRDAVVFYDQAHRIVSTLNICLSCLYMETSMFNHIQGDFATYELLGKFFIGIGHAVED